MISIDFETYLISTEMPIPKPVCLSWSNDLGDSGLVVGFEAMQSLLKDVLQEDVIIAHNFKFEGTVIYEWFPRLRQDLWKAYDEGRVYCTMLYEKIADFQRRKPLDRTPKKEFQQGKKVSPYSLANLVAQYFDEDISAGKSGEDAWRLRYSELDGISLPDWPQEAIDYAINDSIWALKAYNIQIEEGLVVNQELANRAEITLNLMGSTGLIVDTEKVATLTREIAAKLDPNYDYLATQGFYIKGKKKLGLFQEYISMTIPTIMYTNKKKVSTTSEALLYYLSQRDDLIIRAFYEIGEFSKIQTAYINNFQNAIEQNAPMRTSYNSVVSSGRTSSRKDSNYPSMNMQQMPREVKDVTWDVRNCFIPRPGFKIVSIDYAGLELASTAHQLYLTISHAEMRDTVNSGDFPVDMHSKFACRLKTLAEGTYCSYENFMEHKKEPSYKKYRQIAKPINLGFPGGIGYKTMRGLLALDGIRPKYDVLHKSKSESSLQGLQRQLRDAGERDIRIEQTGFREYSLVYDELVGLKRQLFTLYPDLQFFLRHKHKDFQNGKQKQVLNEFGQWEWEPMHKFDCYGITRDWCTYTALCNGYNMQTPAAVGAKEFMYTVIRKYIEDPDMVPLVFIHDEIVFEVRDGPRKESIITDVAEIMITEMQKILSSVRITVEAEEMDYWMKSGGHWSKTYWKDFDSNELRSN